MKNRTQYTKYREKMERLIKECNIGDFSFVEDRTFEEYGEYFLKTIKKEETFKLYRYMPLYRYEDDDKEKETKKSIFNFNSEYIYLSRNGVQNDIFEGLPDSDDYNNYPQDECVKILTNLAYIKCFSESNKNNLMWAHYADSYRGICVEYDICKLTDKDLIKQFFPVHYLKRREMFASVEALIEHIKGNVELEALRDAKGIFLSKSDIWKYEKEWRICYMNHELNKDKFKEIPFDCISAIYMGIRIEEKNIEKVIETLDIYNEKHKKRTTDRIKLYKMKMPKDNSYNLTCEVYDY